VLAGALALAACGSESSSERSQSRATTTTTATTVPATSPTTVGPQTVPVPPVPPPPPSTGPPPPVTVPRSTPSPTVTAAPAPTTSRPRPSTTKPAPIVRKTVVYSPPDAPKRKGDLALPTPHADTIVVLVHSGGGTAGSRKQMRGWADFYASRGYASFAVDYLLFKPTTPAPVYPKPETDVKAAVQYLRDHAGELGVSPERIVVQGFETGGALGAQSEVTPDDPFFGGPAHYPSVSDKPAAFIGFYGHYDGSQRDNTRYYGGPPDSSDPKVKERYAKADSIAHAAGAAGPALLFQGDADKPELVASATNLRDALQSAGKDVTLTLVPGAGAGFDQDKSGALTPAGRQAAQQVVDWLAARFPPK
jgi:acetyl esterase/lipase